MQIVSVGVVVGITPAEMGFLDTEDIDLGFAGLLPEGEPLSRMVEALSIKRHTFQQHDKDKQKAGDEQRMDHRVGITGP